MFLTPPQKATLRTNITALQLSGQPLFGIVNEETIAAYYNTHTGAFFVWKSLVRISEIGDAINANELVGLTSLNLQRLQAIAAFSGGDLNPGLTDRRNSFDQVFSGAGGTITRPLLLALWKRTASRVETLFATGTGTNAVPATLVVEGLISAQNVSDVIGGL